MNESYKQKSEGKILNERFNDDRSRAQRLLEQCKEREKGESLRSIRLGSKTTYLVSAHTNAEQWKANKQRSLQKYRHDDLSREPKFY